VSWTGISSEVLSAQKYGIGLHKMLEISRRAEDLSVSQDGF